MTLCIGMTNRTTEVRMNVAGSSNHTLVTKQTVAGTMGSGLGVLAVLLSNGSLSGYSECDILV